MEIKSNGNSHGNRRFSSRFLVCLLAGMLWPMPLLAADTDEAKRMIENACMTCHKFAGEGESRFNLKAPDLMWGGSKYKREWLIRWLTGKEKLLYAKNYRWDLTQETDQHITVSPEKAEVIADYFEDHLIDSRVEVGAFDLSTVTKMEVAFGAQAYKEHACISCHQIEENGQLVGGPQSTNLSDSGNRYKVDWLYRFGINPQDYVPHSGEFLADASALGLRYIIAYVAVQGVEDFQYYEPWKSEEFEKADVGRGGTIYKQYCSQCHGANGLGDGPAASSLTPRPAVHAAIPFDKVPMEYLYNIVYHGGRSVGRSTDMPYWGLTIGQQGVADVIAYLKATFTGESESSAEKSSVTKVSGVCPQPRQTVSAPNEFLALKSPLPATEANIKAGEKLFHKTATPLACAQCHGEKGDGNGIMAGALDPAPRNFTCAKTMQGISDGQLFWIIKNGSPTTAMMSFSDMPDEQVWQLISYIRTLPE